MNAGLSPARFLSFSVTIKAARCPPVGESDEGIIGLREMKDLKVGDESYV